jgi:uncharacterized protein (DUF2236 family)
VEPGYFGPRSATWRVNANPLLMLGAQRALLMQLAHPAVAQAVLDHSDYERRPIGRLLRTLGLTALMVYGSRADADEAAARINGVHEHVSGTLEWPDKRSRYSALDPHALLWVYATLIDSTLVMSRLTGAADEATLGHFYRQSRVLGRMLRIPDDLLPGDKESFERYVRDRVACPDIAAHPAGPQAAAGVIRPRKLRLLAPVFRSYAALDTRLLPHRLTGYFGLPDDRASRRLAGAILRASRPLASPLRGLSLCILGAPGGRRLVVTALRMAAGLGREPAGRRR